MRSFTIAAALLLAACSSKPNKADPPPVDQGDAGFLLRGEGRSIPELAPLAMLETAPEAKAGESSELTREFMVGDLKVIHRRTPNNIVVQARVYVRGGLANLTSETAGIESLSMQVATSGGTEATPKDVLNAKLDATGAELFSFNDRDASGYGVKTLVEHFDQNWELFTQAILSPAMPEDEIELRRTRQLASIASLLDDPDSHLSHVSRAYMFENHAYSQLHVGSKESVESFTRDELLAYQRAMLVPGNMLVVVVGNLEPKVVEDKVRSSVGRLQPKKVAPIELPVLTSKAGVKFDERQMSTNYIMGFCPAPAPGHPDYMALDFASNYLSYRLFQSIRSDRELTYAVAAGLSSRRTNYAYLYVTATDPKTVLPLMFEEVRKVREELLDEVAMRGTLNMFVTEHYAGQQTNGGQAAALANAELIAGDWRLAESVLTRARAVTAEDVKRVTQQYLKDYRFGVVGPATSLDPALFAGPAK